MQITWLGKALSIDEVSNTRPISAILAVNAYKRKQTEH